MAAETGIFCTRETLSSFQDAKKGLEKKLGGKVYNDLALKMVCEDWLEAQSEEVRSAASE